MRLILSMILALAISAGAAYGACGKKVTNEGTFKTLDTDNKIIVVASKDGEEAKRPEIPSEPVERIRTDHEPDHMDRRIPHQERCRHPDEVDMPQRPRVPGESQDLERRSAEDGRQGHDQ